jgi:hypothetical protein
LRYHQEKSCPSILSFSVAGSPAKASSTKSFSPMVSL